jgi:hypothetical protein
MSALIMVAPKAELQHVPAVKIEKAWKMSPGQLDARRDLPRKAWAP